MARRVASRHVVFALRARSHTEMLRPWSTAVQIGSGRGTTRRRRSSSSCRSFCTRRTRTMQKQRRTADLTRGTEFESATGVVQRSNRNVEVLHAPGRRRNSRQSSSRRKEKSGSRRCFRDTCARLALIPTVRFRSSSHSVKIHDGFLNEPQNLDAVKSKR